MSHSTSPRVVIVGAGPVGLTLALLLDRAGVPVQVLEEASEPITQSRAIWVHSRTLEIWDTIGMAALALAEGREVTGIEMHTSGATRAFLPYDGSPHWRFPHGLMLEQSRTQALLLSLLERTPVEVMWETTLTDLQQGPGGVTISTSHRGEPKTAEALFLIGADGGSSTVRKLIGVELEGGTYDTSFFLADVHADTAMTPSRAHLNFTGPSTVAVLPLPGEGRFRVIGNLIDQTGENREAGYGRALSVEEIESLIAANELPMTVLSTGWSTTYRSHYRVARTFREGPVLLVGDAAHLHSPAGALGMNTGIADAADLAWRVAAVTRSGPERLLDEYATERRGVAKDVIGTSDRLFVLQADTRARFVFARNHVLPRVVNLITRFRAGRGLAFRALSGTSVRYPGERRSRNSRRGVLRAGALLPLTGVTALDDHEALRTGGHLVLAAGTGPAARDATRTLGARRGIPVLALDGPDAQLVAGKGDGPTLAWVRPDRYVGWVGTEPGTLGEILDARLGPSTADPRQEN